jgi:hypothetical protein
MDVEGIEPSVAEFCRPAPTSTTPILGRELLPALPNKEYNARVMLKSRSKYNAGVIDFPSRWSVYCFVSPRGENVIRDWLKREKVPAAQQADFQMKIQLLENGGPHYVPGFITETPVAKDVYKAKIKGNKGWMQLRPLLCKGPWIMDREFTFLIGAIEKDRVLLPKDCKERAQENRRILLADQSRRRHEGVV